MKREFGPTLLLAALAFCGEYRIAGKLLLIDGGGTAIEMGSGSASAERILLSGIESDDRLNYNGQFVKMNVRVTGLGNEKALPRARYQGQIQPASPREEAKVDFAVLLKKTDCQ